MKWIDEADLATWAARLDARAQLPNLVRDLIRASVKDWTRLRFPGGDKGQVRGWDGALEAAQKAKFVPEGKSKWEFGTGAGEKKATSDYSKRTEASGLSIDEQRDTTFVLVNLEAWDTPRTSLAAWETSRTNEGVWKAVKYIDAIELVHWLDEFPAVAARYARLVLGNTPRAGARSTDEFWDMYSRQFKMPLNEKVVIGDRVDEAEAIVQKLHSSVAQPIPICVETAIDGIAFAVAAIRSAPEDIRDAIELRTLIVETEEAAKELSERSLNLIVHHAAVDLVGWLSSRMPTAYALTGVKARQKGMMKRSSATAMADGFLAMGMSRDEGYELAYRCGRSLTILARIFSDQPCVDPAWVAHAHLLKPALLAGGWFSNVQLDQQAIAKLSGSNDYHALEEDFRAFALHDDPPLDRVSSQWQVRAPVDAFSFYAPLLTSRDLQRLKDVAIMVLGHVAAPPPRDEIFRPGRESVADYSKPLREGIAMTLVLIACLHGAVGLQIDDGTPQSFVDGVVRALPGFGRSHEWILALGQQAALVAEASPNSFMQALESMLEGLTEPLSALFIEQSSDIFAPTSPHVELLWALEGLAWHVDYLDRAVLILGGLAAMDTIDGRKLGNRPIDSLREILLPWAPSTYAGLAQRIRCIDQLIARYPTVAWELLIKLLPNPHDTSVDTYRQRLRDPRPMDEEILTYGRVWDGHSAVVERAVALARVDGMRIASLLSHVNFMSEKDSAKVIELTESYLEPSDQNEADSVLEALQQLVSRAQYVSTESSDESVTQSMIDRAQQLLASHRPIGAVSEARRLFDEWLPISRSSMEMSQERLKELRIAALSAVFASEGASGILSVIANAKVPELVGPLLTDLSLCPTDLEYILQISRERGNRGNILAHASFAGLQSDPAWRSRISDIAQAWADDPQSVAALLAGWPLTHTTWDFVADLGTAVRQAYWNSVGALPEGNAELLLRGVEEFMRAGRSLYVLAAAHRSLNDLPTRVLTDVLHKGLTKAEDDAVLGGSTMLSYYLKAAFVELKTREDIALEELVGLEYGYFPLLEHEKLPLAIYEHLAVEPTFFIELLSHVFRAEGEPARDSDEKEARRATNSFRVLSAFTKLPGVSDSVEAEKLLSKWIEDVQKLAKQAGRSKIADSYIGKLLAHAPMAGEGELWPPASVCDAIEKFATDSLLSGFRMECFNKRGVYSKGPYEGGKQERTLAERYRYHALSARSYPRTAQLLAAIEKDWLHQAEAEDVRAEQEKMNR